MIPLSKPVIGNQEIRMVTRVLKSGIIAQGPRVKELEKKLAVKIDEKLIDKIVG